VVVVAGASGSGAPGEDAGAVAEVDWFLDALGHRVGVGVCAGVEVEDRSHGDLRVGAAAPRPDLLDRHEGVAAFEPGDGIGPGQGSLGEVDVEDDVPRLHFPRPGCVVGRSRKQVEGLLAAGEVAEGLGAAYVEGLGGSQVGSLCGAGLEGCFEVEGVGDVELGLEVMVPVYEPSW
jgi:hypothetical protein